MSLINKNNDSSLHKKFVFDCWNSDNTKKWHTKKFENSKFMNTKFMTKYEEKWNYRTKKSLFSSIKLSNHLKKNNFSIITKTKTSFFIIL